MYMKYLKKNIPTSFNLSKDRGGNSKMFVSKGWVTNGHFAIREDFVKPKQLATYKYFASSDQPSIERIIPSEEDTPIELIDTNIIHSEKDISVRLLISPEPREIVCIATKYFDFFLSEGVQIYCNRTCDPFYARDNGGEICFVIMPHKAEQSKNALNGVSTFLGTKHYMQEVA
jgi:hypothetical protein